MRLTCPNCDAHYEVPDEVIPPAGRDVQCSNCGKTWYQHHPDYQPAPEPVFARDLSPEAPEQDEEVVPTQAGSETTEARRRQLDPAIAEILRQEAEIEHEARRRRQLDQTLESQPDLGLEAPAPSAREQIQEPQNPQDAQQTAERIARMSGTPDIPQEAVAAAAAISSRRELLPDIDEINSTLRNESSSSNVSAIARDEFGAAGDPRPGGGFRRGFLTMMLVFGVLFLVYLFAPQIADLVPPLEGALAAYVTWVDQLRVSLDTWLRSVVTMLEGMAGQSDT